MDIYSTRALLAAVELMPREYSFLFDTFCRDAGVVEDDKAIYDYRKGQRRMAPVVHPGTGGVVMERDGYETREVGFCTVAPERLIQMKDLIGRAFGEDVLGSMTPQEREKKLLASDLVDMRKAIQRRREHMARQVLLTGKLELFKYTNEGRDKTVTLAADYGFTNFYTPETPWDQAGAKQEEDMQKIFDLAYDGLGYVDVICMAPDVASCMLYTDYIKRLDIRNVDVGDMNVKYRGQGVRFIGHNIDGAEMYSVSGTYIDDDGQSRPLMPSGTLVAGYKGMLKCHHGPVTQVEEEGMNAQHKTYIKKEVPLRLGSVAGNSIKTRLTSCPTVIPENVDGWVVASVL